MSPHSSLSVSYRVNLIALITSGIDAGCFDAMAAIESRIVFILSVGMLASRFSLVWFFVMIFWNILVASSMLIFFS